MKAKTTKREVSLLVRSFLDGSIGMWDWDDFTSVPQADPEIESVRLRLIAIHDQFPADSRHPRAYCSDEGMAELLRIANALDESGSSVSE